MVFVRFEIVYMMKDVETASHALIPGDNAPLEIFPPDKIPQKYPPAECRNVK